MAAKRRARTLADVTTPAGRFSIRSESKPYVRAREERAPGSNLVLDYQDPAGGRVKETIDLSVRGAGGRIDWDRVERALEKANDRSAELRLGRERALAEPLRLTVGGAFALYHDPAEGALRSVSATYRASHVRARAFWETVFGTDLPWNQMSLTKRDAELLALKQAGQLPKAEQFLDRLRIVWGWLTEKREIEGLKDPSRKFDRVKFRGGYQPRRPRYPEEEIIQLIEVSRRVDPRFRLLFSFANTSGSRGGQIRTAWRSGWNVPLASDPEPADAPHGWIAFRGVKGQQDQLVFLTTWQVEELVGAVGGYWDEAAARFRPGYLSKLEARYGETGEDYPLFPGGHLRGGLAELTTRRSTALRPLRPIGPTQPLRWLAEAEALAGVPHRERRGLHGVRRAWAKYSRREIGKTAATHAGGWSREETMEQIYAGERYEDLAASREAQERRRGRSGADSVGKV